MTGYIYCHTSPSCKKYIGQTTTSLQHRYNNGNNYVSSPVFWKAIQKYGWDNFTHEILYTVEENDKQLLIEQLNFLEKKAIKEYNTLVPNGYNVDNGGGQNKTTIEKAQSISKTILGDKAPTKDQLIDLYINKNLTMKQVGDILGIGRDSVSKWLKWYNIPVNYKHRNSTRISKEELKELYIDQNLTQKQCSEILDINIHKIADLVKEYELYKRRAKND